MARFVFRITGNQVVDTPIDVDTLMRQWTEIDNVSMVILNLSEGATVKSVVRPSCKPSG